MDDDKLYKCEDCGLHYRDDTLAQACYEFCTKNNACSIEITKHSIETTEATEE